MSKTATARFTYPRIGTLVMVTYVGRVDPSLTYEYAGVVYADRYPEYALSVGELRIPWSNVKAVVPC